MRFGGGTILISWAHLVMKYAIGAKLDPNGIQKVSYGCIIGSLVTIPRVLTSVLVDVRMLGHRNFPNEKKICHGDQYMTFIIVT